MSFENLGISERVIYRLKSAILNNKIMHAYIFEGDTCIDKSKVAKEFSKAVLCREKKGVGCDMCSICKKIEHDNHEDIFFVELSEKGNILDDSIIELQEKLRRKPLSGDINIAIIQNADKMNVRAQNRLLKTLEEPIGNSIIILLSENTERLLQTIRSRCSIYRINDYGSFPENEFSTVAEELIELLIERKPFYMISQTIAEVVKNRHDSMKLLEAMEYLYRNLVFDYSPRAGRFKKENIHFCIEKIEEAKKLLDANVVVPYVIKGLFLELEDLQ